MPRTAKARPFASNLEYLVATLDYLQTLARKRIAARHLEAERNGIRASHYEQSEREELLGSAADNCVGLERLQRHLDTELQQKHVDLDRRTQTTLAAASPDLPLEDLARDYGLSEFEKLVLVLVLGPDLDSHFSRFVEALSQSHGVEMRTILDILCDGVQEKIQARRYFIHSGNLLSHGLLNLAHNHEQDSESEFMRMDIELPRRVSSLILGEYDIDDQVVCFSAVVDPEIDLDQVVLPPGRRQEVLELLFFDEADALFARRLDETDHHARYLNQQVDVLLTEMEKFDGIVILATNRAESFDQAFERRIRYRVHFPRPDETARLAIWQGLMPSEAPVAPDIDFARLAREYDFAGGTIRNVMVRAAFEAATDGQVITAEILARCAAQETPLCPIRPIGFNTGEK